MLEARLNDAEQRCFAQAEAVEDLLARAHAADERSARAHAEASAAASLVASLRVDVQRSHEQAGVLELAVEQARSRAEATERAHVGEIDELQCTLSQRDARIDEVCVEFFPLSCRVLVFPIFQFIMTLFIYFYLVGIAHR